MSVSSVNEYFSTLNERFNADAAKGVELVFQWNITGDGGGTWHAVVNDGTMQLNEGATDNPTVAITISGDNYVKLINGKLKGAFAVMTRKMKVTGNIAAARKLQKIFPVNKK